jgi:hypothetical protein
MAMIDRQKVETILMRRFPGAGHPQIAAAANAIMGLPDEWEEVGGDLARLMRETKGEAELKILRRRQP